LIVVLVAQTCHDRLGYGLQHQSVIAVQPVLLMVLRESRRQAVLPHRGFAAPFTLPSLVCGLLLRVRLALRAPSVPL
jgi:hypothetical protein